MKVKKDEKVIEVKFTKEQLLESKRYRDRKDIINVLLKDNQSYNFKEVDDLVEKYMKGKVN